MPRKSSLVLLLIPLLLAACGGQSASTPENTPAPLTATPAPSANKSPYSLPT